MRPYATSMWISAGSRGAIALHGSTRCTAAHPLRLPLRLTWGIQSKRIERAANSCCICWYAALRPPPMAFWCGHLAWPKENDAANDNGEERNAAREHGHDAHAASSRCRLCIIDRLLAITLHEWVVTQRLRGSFGLHERISGLCIYAMGSSGMFDRKGSGSSIRAPLRSTKGARGEMGWLFGRVNLFGLIKHTNEVLADCGRTAFRTTRCTTLGYGHKIKPRHLSAGARENPATTRLSHCHTITP